MMVRFQLITYSTLSARWYSLYWHTLLSLSATALE